MKLPIVHLLLPVAAMICLSADQSRALDLGESAPPLQVGAWIKGPPVDLQAGRGSNIFVVDFWTIYSGAFHYSVPYLSNLQNKYKDRGVEMEKKAIAQCSDTHFRPELESVLMRFERLSRTNAIHK